MKIINSQDFTEQPGQPEISEVAKGKATAIEERETAEFLFDEVVKQIGGVPKQKREYVLLYPLTVQQLTTLDIV